MSRLTHVVLVQSRLPCSCCHASRARAVTPPVLVQSHLTPLVLVQSRLTPLVLVQSRLSLLVLVQLRLLCSCSHASYARAVTPLVLVQSHLLCSCSHVSRARAVASHVSRARAVLLTRRRHTTTWTLTTRISRTRTT